MWARGYIPILGRSGLQWIPNIDAKLPRIQYNPISFNGLDKACLKDVRLCILNQYEFC